METKKLPLQIGNGVLVPFQDSVSFESSATALLEMQMTTEGLKITKQIQDTRCFAEFIKIEGCYSCPSGATLILEARVDFGSNIATLECAEAGLFIPIHLTSQLEKHHLVVKLDNPDVNLQCQFKCSRNIIPLMISGELQYLSNVDMRETRMDVSNEPVHAFPGFNFLSLYGFGLSEWIYRGGILILVVFTILLTFITSVKLIMKKII